MNSLEMFSFFSMFSNYLSSSSFEILMLIILKYWFHLKIILKYCEKIRYFNRCDFYTDFICNLNHNPRKFHWNVRILLGFKMNLTSWTSCEVLRDHDYYCPLGCGQWNYLPGWTQNFTTIQHKEILKPRANRVKSHASNHLI